MNAILAIKMEGLKKNELSDLAKILQQMDESMSNIEKPENINKLKEAYEVFTGKKTSFSTITLQEDKKPASKADLTASNTSLKKQIDEDSEDTQDELHQTKEELQRANEELQRLQQENTERLENNQNETTEEIRINQDESTTRVLHSIDRILRNVQLAVFRVPHPEQLEYAQLISMNTLLHNKDDWIATKIRQSIATIANDETKQRETLRDIYGITEPGIDPLETLKQELKNDLERLFSQMAVAIVNDDSRALQRITETVADIDIHNISMNNIRSIQRAYSEVPGISLHFLRGQKTVGDLSQGARVRDDIELPGRPSKGVLLYHGEISKLVDETGKVISNLRQWPEMLQIARNVFDIPVESIKKVSPEKLAELSIYPTSRDIRSRRISNEQFVSGMIDERKMVSPEFGSGELYWESLMKKIVEKDPQRTMNIDILDKNTRLYTTFQNVGNYNPKISEVLAEFKRLQEIDPGTGLPASPEARLGEPKKIDLGVILNKDAMTLLGEMSFQRLRYRKRLEDTPEGTPQYGEEVVSTSMEQIIDTIIDKEVRRGAIDEKLAIFYKNKLIKYMQQFYDEQGMKKIGVAFPKELMMNTQVKPYASPKNLQDALQEAAESADIALLGNVVPLDWQSFGATNLPNVGALNESRLKELLEAGTFTEKVADILADYLESIDYDKERYVKKDIKDALTESTELRDIFEAVSNPRPTVNGNVQDTTRDDNNNRRSV